MHQRSTTVSDVAIACLALVLFSACDQGHGGAKDADAASGATSSGGVTGSPGSGGTSVTSTAVGAAAGGSGAGGRVGTSTGLGGAAGTVASDGGQGGNSTNGGAGGTAPVSTICPTFDACGGSVVGAWKLPGKAICGDISSGTTPPSSCPGYSATTNMEQSGTLTFKSDGTYDFIQVTQGTEDFIYPRGCIGGMSCDELASQMIASADRASGSCSENASQACVCSFRDVAVTQETRGTYTASGGQLAMTRDGLSGTQTSAYCVQSDVLAIHVQDPTGNSAVTMEYTRQ